MINLAIAGASGKMGRMLLEACAADADTQLVAALDAAQSPAVGVSARAFGGNLDVNVSVDAAALPRGAVLIDFTRPEATLAYIDACVQAGVGMVIGTTGFDDAGKAKIASASKQIPIVFSPNYSVGVNTVFKLLELAAKSLDSSYDVEIIEMHHRMKVDAPSGTALMLGEAAAEGRGISLDGHRDSGRDGITGARSRGNIGFSSVRGGDIVGEHDVIFAANGERIVLRHIATDRTIFARGALRAAVWGQDRKPGEYDMMDVLGL